MASRVSELDAVFAAGGEVGAIMRRLDWARTPCGPLDGWPQSLRTAVGIVLASRHPLIVWWGADQVMFYNDALAPSFGEIHPAAVGCPGRDMLPDMWPRIGPMLEGVLAGGEPTWREDEALPMVRHGFVEDTFWTYSYSAIHDHSGAVAGVFTGTSETTARVLHDRRLGLLREVAKRILDARTPEQVCAAIAEVLTEAPDDVPFALVYLLDAAGQRASLEAAAGIEAGGTASPTHLDVATPGAAWPLADVVTSAKPVTIAAPDLPELPDARRPRTATIVPVARVGYGPPRALLVGGHAPRISVDQDYERFFEQLAAQLSRGIADAEAHQAERKRTETLQRSLLPALLPEIPGIQLAASYHPARSAQQVGGDFYDIVQVAGGWFVVIGDVCGKGVEAAVLTSLARYTLRAAARIDARPSHTLRFLHETLLVEGSGRFCTVVGALLEPHSGGLRATIALGGHPQPLLLTAGEAPRFVGTHGTLLGMIPETDISDHEVNIGLDQALLFYTDGATDARVGPRRLEEEGLRDRVAAADSLEPSRVLALVEETLFGPGVTCPDDIALVCVRPRR